MYCVCVYHCTLYHGVLPCPQCSYGSSDWEQVRDQVFGTGWSGYWPCPVQALTATPLFIEAAFFLLVIFNAVFNTMTRCCSYRAAILNLFSFFSFASAATAAVCVCFWRPCLLRLISFQKALVACVCCIHIVAIWTRDQEKLDAVSVRHTAHLQSVLCRLAFS